ncbi:MAG: glycoside hydrolase family 57 protein [Candidatus Omnitrophica bacterium]|nr:glycoside hydrolase family 57 protein [Candidatus Omnitrophota bacterium]
MYLSILWHMHQPCYLINGKINTPTLVFRTLFNYYPMIILAEKFPSVKLNFNITPILLKQIEGLSSGKYEDRFMSLLQGKESDANEVFMLARELPSHILKRHPAINILLDKIKSRSYSEKDVSDIKVLLHLVCFHPLIKDAEIEELVKKGRGFNNNDKELLLNKENHILKETLKKYRELMEKGQIEISTSPMMHPILPLVYNTDIAKQTKTSLYIPEGIFSYPEDAKRQILEGIETYKNIFGKLPSGIWPSEGGLSDEILELFSEYHILWTATDECLLAETLSKPLTNREHYNIWEYKNGISIFFRDHHISDLIGFSYQKMEEKKSAVKLFEHLNHISEGISDRILSIILDGENPWDFYPDYGTFFLSTLYEMLSNSVSIRTTTFSEALKSNIIRNKLDRISPGSWMGVNFDNWIGKEPANKAWNILKQAREVAEEKMKLLNEEKKKVIMDCIMLAESSDWFWWYSLPVEKDIKTRFDTYFRNSIREIYETAGIEPPEYLAYPVEQYITKDIIPYISPTIDGKITHFYEWYNAVEVDVFSLWTTFKPVGFPVKKIFYGYDENNFYLRIDTSEKETLEFSISFINSLKKTFNIKYGRTLPQLFFQWDDIIEISIPRKEVLSEEEKLIFFNITIKKGVEEIVIPATDYFNVRFGEKGENWIV